MSTKSAKPLTVRQINIIRRESFEQLAKKAEDEIRNTEVAHNKKVNAQLSKKIRQKSFHSALIKAVDEAVDKATANGEAATYAASQACHEVLQGISNKPCLHKEIKYIKIRTSKAYRDYFRCLKSRAEEYELIAKDISNLELQHVLGGDAVAILDNILARIAKL